MVIFSISEVAGLEGEGVVMTYHKINYTATVNKSILETYLLLLTNLNPKYEVDFLLTWVFLDVCMIKVYLWLKHVTRGNQILRICLLLNCCTLLDV
jgi:hypothetical protein